MLQHDYILGLIQQFCQAIMAALRAAFIDGDKTAPEQIEAAVGDLIQLDPATAMALSPGSLVTMMRLSGVGETVASYAAWTLDRLGNIYDADGDGRGSIRHAQAAAIAEAFGYDLSICPEEFEELEHELEEKGRHEHAL